MKVGSVVECINNSMFSDKIELNTPYVVREIIPLKAYVFSRTGLPAIIVGEVCIKLEGIEAGIFYAGAFFDDMPFPMRLFRELMPNMEKEISEILEQVILT